MDKDLVDFCVNFAQKNGADYSEARLVSTIEEGYILKNGTFESSTFSQTEGIGFRVLVDGGMSFLAINKFDKETIKNRILEAIKYAKVSAKKLKSPLKFSQEKTVKGKWHVRQKIKLEEVGPDEKMADLLEIEKSLSELKNKLPSRVFSLIASKEDKYFVNSEGSAINAQIPRVALYASIVAHDNGNFEQLNQGYSPKGGSGGWELFKGWKLHEVLLDEGKMLLKILREAKSVPKATRDVILAPQMVGIAMHESVGHPGEADRPMGREGSQAGETYVTNEWIGKRIGSEHVTVVDDPTAEGSYGFYVYDEEGVKAGKRVLIKDGILNGYLHNRATSSIFGIQSNAAARASAFDREPLIRMSTTFMLPGDFDFDEIFEDVKNGIYIKGFTEWNIDDKRWNEKYVGSEAYLIQDGEMKGLVKRPVLEITTQGFFSSVDAVCKEKYLDFIAGPCGKGDPMQAVPVWMGGPPIRLRDIHIGSA